MALDRYEELDWPAWARAAWAAVVVVLATTIALQHRAHLSRASAALLVAAAVVPWLVECAGFAVPRFVVVPAVIGAVAWLVSSPARNDFSPFLLVLLAADCGVNMAPLTSGLVALAGAGVMIGWELAGRFQGSFIWSAGIALGWVVGTGYQWQQQLLVELRAAQAELADQAAAGERQRIAREIHDTIAHSLTVTMLHLTGARLALKSDPADAEQALLEAERLGRQSLADIRRTVGLLAPGSADATAPPMPTAADIADLVADFTAAGLVVHLDVAGDLRAVPPATGLGLYRITQESLANVAKHAPRAPTDVLLHVENGTAQLRVRNGAGGGAPLALAAGGNGLRGLRERADLLGAELHAGPDGDGWCVEVVLTTRTG